MKMMFKMMAIINKIYRTFLKYQCSEYMKIMLCYEKCNLEMYSPSSYRWFTSLFVVSYMLVFY